MIIRPLITCSVVTCLSLNLSSTNLSTHDVLPTQPSPNNTTLKLLTTLVLLLPDIVILIG